MNQWLRITDYPADEHHKLRWLLRHAPDNGIVESGVALKFGREWRINRDKLPEFLSAQTLATLKRERAAG